MAGSTHLQEKQDGAKLPLRIRLMAMNDEHARLLLLAVDGHGGRRVSRPRRDPSMECIRGHAQGFADADTRHLTCSNQGVDL